MKSQQNPNNQSAVYKDASDLFSDALRAKIGNSFFIDAATLRSIKSDRSGPWRTTEQWLEMLNNPALKAEWRDKIRHHDLVYGYWRCKDGRLVAFNRPYSPIWSKRLGEDWKPANRDEWIDNIRLDKSGEEAGRMFYDDWTPRHLKLEKALKGMVHLGIISKEQAAPILKLGRKAVKVGGRP
jgi:hypothetical protein